MKFGLKGRPSRESVGAEALSLQPAQFSPIPQRAWVEERYTLSVAVAEDCKRTVEVEIPAGEVDREYSRIAGDFQKQARIPGFRPGRAPLSLVRKRFDDKIREEVLGALLPAHLRSAFERENLEPVSRPTVDDLHFEVGEPIRFKASFEVLPTVTLGDYKSIKVEPTEVTVADDDVEKALGQIREQRATTEEIKADEGQPAPVVEDGVIAVASSERQMDGDAEPARTESIEVEVGNEETLPEFTAALRGAAVGDERDLDVSYPADFPSEFFAGKTAHYKLKVTGMKRRILPELNDEFAREVSSGEAPVETLDALRQRLRENIEAERRHQAHHETEEKLIDQLLAMHTFPVPNALVEQQIDSRLERSLRSLSMQGIDPRKLNLDWSGLRERQRESSSRDVQLHLLISKIAEAEGIQAPEEEVDAEINRIAGQMHQTPEVVRQRLTEDGVLDSIKSRIRSQKVMDLLFESATGTKPTPHTHEA